MLWAIIVFPLMGLFSLVESSFSWAFVLCAYIAYELLHRLAHTKSKDSKKIARYIVSVGTLLVWISLWLSHSRIPYLDNSSPIAEGGFPFTAFEYPVPPMGGDVPPPHMWPMFFLNFAFWLFIAYLTTLFIPEKKLLTSHVQKTLVILATIVTLCSLGYIMLLFD